MIVKDPFNINIMNIDKFINFNNLLPVTSHNIYKASTNNFHPEGLFSEEIFGQIETEQRLTKFGYIDLNIRILHPLIYKNLTSRFTSLYNEVITGKSYVTYDDKEKDLVLSDENDPNADTGFSYFMNIFNKIEFKQTKSSTRDIKIQLIDKYRKHVFIDKYLVIPAGVRDIKLINNRIDKEKINSLYLSLMSLAQSIPIQMSDDPIFDGIKLSIQLKANEIYNHISSRWIEGKRGFLQNKYVARSVSLGTRNVITAADMTGRTADDPSFLKYNETQVTLIQSIKMFQPLVYNVIKTMFIEPIFSEGHVNVPVIDPKSLNLVFKPISELEKNNFLTSEGINTLINKFNNKYVRSRPFTIQTDDGSYGFLYLVYEYNNNIFLFRNIDEFKEIAEKQNIPFNRKLVRPLTYVELFYIATYRATENKHMFGTRYPVTSIESTYPSKVKVASTMETKKITLIAFTNGQMETAEEFPLYPIINQSFVDSLVVHPSKLDALGGDYDRIKCTA